MKPTKLMRPGTAVLALVVVILCAAVAAVAQTDPLLAKSWDEIVKEARGQTVHWWMWAGDEGVNRYVDQWVAPRVKELYGITVKRVAIKDTVEGVQKVVGEKQAGKTTGGAVDLNWISGENLFTMKQGGLLFTGYRDKLPGSRHINWEEPVIRFDRAIPVDGAAIPWGRYQYVLAYDSAKVPSPPKSMAALAAWVKANPGKFTYPAPPDFTGTNFLLQVLYEVTGGYQQWLGDFDEARFREKSPPVWQYLNEIKPHLWRRGETYPEGIAALDQLYATGEVQFSMSMYYSVPARNVAKGLYAKTTRTAVLDAGTVSAAHFIGIPFNSSSKAGAMVLIDFLIGPEPQYQKALPDVWGIGTILDMKRLPADWQAKFRDIPRGEATLDPVTLDARKAPAIHAKYVPAIEKAWKEHVLLKK
jgi:putative spermidine/putrescine transport system substrate-binding protein